MVIDNAYYKKIIYKKNAFEDLKTYIKLNYSTKKILLVSEVSIASEDVTDMLNALFVSSEKVSHFVFKNGYSNLERSTLKNKITSGGYGLIVSFGGGCICDVVKYFSYIFKIPYVACPTSATSLAYFTNYCFNPDRNAYSLYANMPNKIFIQESIIKNANLHDNIEGLCLLHSLRSVYVEGLLADDEKSKYIFLGLEKLFNKLDEEQLSILLCGEDANLILMDLMIDFGFFVAMLNKDNFYLYNMYALYSTFLNEDKVDAGAQMLLCSKVILSTLNAYFELKNFSCLEKPKCDEIVKIAKKYQINYKILKNNEFLNKKMKNLGIISAFSKKLPEARRAVLMQIYKIKNFCNVVKSVYKNGIQIEGNYKRLTEALAVSPYIYEGGGLANILAGSGILNSFLQTL